MRTIFALATARGKSGVAIIRVSGPDALDIGRVLTGALPDRMGLRMVRDSAGEVLDHALVLVFRAPNSFTGEDVVEFQLHGSPAIIAAVEGAILKTGLAVSAEAGDFTRRALLNDTLDLAQVEGLGDLIEAETEAQRRQAMRVFSGALGQRIEGWRADLLRAAALLEVSIDFVDEEVPVDVRPEALELLTCIITVLEGEIAGTYVAERVRDGFEVAILGAPNAGKSTLLNTIAGRDVAITSEIAGTTRDVIEVRMDLRGVPVTFLDTAGLRSTEDAIEKIGVSRAIDRARDADLRVLLRTEDWDSHAAGGLVPDLVYLAKADLVGGEGISGLTGQGVDALLADVARFLEAQVNRVETAISPRHRDAMQRAVAELQLANQWLVNHETLEMSAEHIRSALRALDSLIGRVDVEAILGEIFSRFCIGK